MVLSSHSSQFVKRATNPASQFCVPFLTCCQEAGETATRRIRRLGARTTRRSLFVRLEWRHARARLGLSQRPPLGQRTGKALTAPQGNGSPWRHGRPAVKDAKTDRQLRLYVGLVAFAGAACLPGAVLTAPAVPVGMIFYFAALAVIITASSGQMIVLRVRSDHRSFSATSGSI